MIKNSFKGIKKLDKGEGTVVIATLGAVDKDGDVTLPGAFGRQVVPMVPAHDWKQAPIGKASIYEHDGEALADIKLNLNTNLGKNWYEALKFDLDHPPAKQEYSYGYSIGEGGAEFGDFGGKRVRFLKSLELHEVSPVLLGAGVQTRTLSLKDAHEVLTSYWLDPDGKGLRDMGINEVHLERGPKRTAIEWLVKVACNVEGVRTPEVKFFQNNAKYNGLCPHNKSSIYLYEGLGGYRLLEVIGHEVRHLKHYGPPAPDFEADAARAGHDFARKFLPHEWITGEVRIYDGPVSFNNFSESYEIHKDLGGDGICFNLNDGSSYQRVHGGWVWLKTWLH